MGRPGAALLRGRRAAERMMVDTCTVTVQGVPVTDDAGKVTMPAGALVYEGRCKLQDGTAMAARAEAAGHRFTIERKELHVPAGIPGLGVGMLVEIIESAFQPTLVGEKYRLVEPSAKSWQTAQRWIVERKA